MAIRTDTPTAANFVDWRDQNQVFEGMAAMDETSFNLTGSGDPERLEGRRVSTSLFHCSASSHSSGAFLPRPKINPAPNEWSY